MGTNRRRDRLSGRLHSTAPERLRRLVTLCPGVRLREAGARQRARSAALSGGLAAAAVLLGTASARAAAVPVRRATDNAGRRQRLGAPHRPRSARGLSEPGRPGTWHLPRRRTHGRRDVPQLQPVGHHARPLGLLPRSLAPLRRPRPRVSLPRRGRRRRPRGSRAAPRPGVVEGSDPHRRARHAGDPFRPGSRTPGRPVRVRHPLRAGRLAPGPVSGDAAGRAVRPSVLGLRTPAPDRGGRRQDLPLERCPAPRAPPLAPPRPARPPARATARTPRGLYPPGLPWPVRPALARRARGAAGPRHAPAAAGGLPALAGCRVARAQRLSRLADGLVRRRRRSSSRCSSRPRPATA